MPADAPPPDFSKILLGLTATGLAVGMVAWLTSRADLAGWIWLAVTIPVLFGAFLYDRFKYAPLRRTEINAKLLKIKKEKEQSDAAFKVFLAESPEQRKQREAIKDER